MRYKSNLRELPALVTAFLLFILFLTTGCQKEGSTTETETVLAAAADDAEADVTFDDVSNGISGVNEDIGVAQTDIGAGDQPTDPTATRCYTVTITNLTANNFPKQVVLDFGTGCLGRDGKIRKGKIITVFTGPLRIPGSKATTSFDGFYVNLVHVEGIHIIQNNSTSAVWVFTTKVENGKLSKPNGNYIKWNATHTTTQVAGLGTPNFHFDDAFTITGNASGENSRNGNISTWTRVIGDPLHKKVICRWFDKGNVTITHNGHAGTLDFGDGACNNKATVTYNGNTKEITLP